MNGKRTIREGKNGGRRPGLPGMAESCRGFTLIELLIVITLFALVMAALQQTFSAQVRMGIMREYRLAEAEMELGIVKTIITRDLSMAGHGLPEIIDSALRPALKVVSGVEGTNSDDGPDTLILRGMAIGRESRAAQGWTYQDEDILTHSLALKEWNDARENLQPNDAVILMDPTIRKLKYMFPSGDWVFRYNGPSSVVTSLSGTPGISVSPGDVLYGFYNTGSSATLPKQPYYAVRYYLGGETFPATCAPGTRSLMRAESRTDAAPSGGEGRHILNCVLDFQVALGIDEGNLADKVDDRDGMISFWDNGGVAFTAAAGPADAALAIDNNSNLFRNLNKNLRQIRVYVLVQDGNRDQGYFYSNPDPAYSDKPNKIRVGELGLQGGPVGRDVTLTDEQRRYRWRVLSIAVTPRNIW